MNVKVKFENDKVKELYLKASKGNSIFPFKTYDKDFCYDVVATSCEEVAPNVYKYGIGLAFQIERDGFKPMFGKYDYVGYGFEDVLSTKLKDVQLSIDFRPRSSVWKTGMILSNCQGTVDELYRGEVSAVFYHVMPNMKRYTVGQRIGQIKLGITIPCEFVEVDELTPTIRNTNGYGSTGE